MKGIRAATRAAWIQKILGRGHKFTVKQMERALLIAQFKGRHCAAPADGPALEQIVLVDDAHPMGNIVKAYRDGVRWFEQADLNVRLGADVAMPAGARRLAQAGFAVVDVSNGRVQLRAADPRAARFVNEARLGPQRIGFSSRRVIEAFYAFRQPKRCRVNDSEDRRLGAAEVLQAKWGIRCEDLLDGRARVRLISAWTFGTAA